MDGGGPITSLEGVPRPRWLVLVGASSILGLLALCFLRVSGPSVPSEPDIWDKVRRNVEWKTWETTLIFLTDGKINPLTITSAINSIPEEAGGPYPNLSLDVGTKPQVFFRNGPRRGIWRRRAAFWRATGVEPPPFRRPPPWLRRQWHGRNRPGGVDV